MWSLNLDLDSSLCFSPPASLLPAQACSHFSQLPLAPEICFLREGRFVFTALNFIYHPFGFDYAVRHGDPQLNSTASITVPAELLQISPGQSQPWPLPSCPALVPASTWTGGGTGRSPLKGAKEQMAASVAHGLSKHPALLPPTALTPSPSTTFLPVDPAQDNADPQSYNIQGRARPALSSLQGGPSPSSNRASATYAASTEY